MVPPREAYQVAKFDQIDVASADRWSLYLQGVPAASLCFRYRPRRSGKSSQGTARGPSGFRRPTPGCAPIGNVLGGPTQQATPARPFDAFTSLRLPPGTRSVWLAFLRLLCYRRCGLASCEIEQKRRPSDGHRHELIIRRMGGVLLGPHDQAHHLDNPRRFRCSREKT